MDNYMFRIDDIIKNYYGLFANNPNIRGVGRGNKIINGNITDIPVLTVFVKKKVKSNLLSSENVIPKYIRGALTDVYESGIIRSMANELRPAVGGISIGSVEFDLTGTLGYAVVGKKDKKLYILTCAHIITPEYNLKSPAPKFLQPSIRDGGVYRKSFIGVAHKTILTRFGKKTIEKEMNEVDAGLIYVGENTTRIQSERLLPVLLDKSKITGTAKAKPGEVVWKIGRSSGKTTGKVISVNTNADLEDEYSKNTITYKNQIITDVPLERGDSGSIGIIQNGNKAFGLAIGSDGDIGMFNDIGRVLELLEVEFAYPIN